MAVYKDYDAAFKYLLQVSLPSFICDSHGGWVAGARRCNVALDEYSMVSVWSNSFGAEGRIV